MHTECVGPSWESSVLRFTRGNRVIGTAAVSVAAVLTLSGCNGSDGAAAVDQLSPVAAIQKVADNASTDSATYTVELAGQGVSVKGAGAYRGGDNPAAQMAFDSMKVAGFSMPAGTEFRLVGDVMYLKSSKGGLIPGVGDGSWVKIPMGDVKAEGNSVGGLDLTMMNPADELKKMLDTQDVTKVGTETVDGAKTTHYRATVDSTGTGTVTEKKTESSDELSRQLEEQLSNSIKESMGLTKPVVVDAWVDGDYHARKLQVTLPFLDEMTMTMRFAHFGEDVTIEAPADAKELDLSGMLSGKLGDAFGKQFADQFGKDLNSDPSRDDLSKAFADLFGSDVTVSPGLSGDFQQKLQAEIEKRLQEHGVSSGGTDAVVSS